MDGALNDLVGVPVRLSSDGVSAVEVVGLTDLRAQTALREFPSGAVWGKGHYCVQQFENNEDSMRLVSYPSGAMFFVSNDDCAVFNTMTAGCVDQGVSPTRCGRTPQ